MWYLLVTSKCLIQNRPSNLTTNISTSARNVSQNFTTYFEKKAIFYYDTVTDGVYGLAATLSRSLARSTNDNIIFPNVLCSLSNELIFQLMKQPCFVSVFFKNLPHSRFENSDYVKMFGSVTTPRGSTTIEPTPGVL